MSSCKSPKTRLFTSDILPWTSSPSLATCQGDTAKVWKRTGVMFHVRLHMSMRWMYSVTNKNSVGRQYCFDAYTYATNKHQAASCSSARNSPSTWTNIPKIGYHSSLPGYTPSKQGTYIILDHMTSRDLFANILPSNFFAILLLEQFQCPSNAINERFTAGTVHGNTHKCQTQMLGLPLHNVNPQLWKLDLHHFGWWSMDIGMTHCPRYSVYTCDEQIDMVQSAWYICGSHHTLRWCSR